MESTTSTQPPPPAPRPWVPGPDLDWAAAPLGEALDQSRFGYWSHVDEITDGLVFHSMTQHARAPVPWAWFTDDLATWQSIEFHDTYARFNASAQLGDTIVSVGYDPVLRSAVVAHIEPPADEEPGSGVVTPLYFDHELIHVSAHPDGFVAVGAELAEHGGSESALFVSSDGYEWRLVTTVPFIVDFAETAPNGSMLLVEKYLQAEQNVLLINDADELFGWQPGGPVLARRVTVPREHGGVISSVHADNESFLLSGALFDATGFRPVLWTLLHDEPIASVEEIDTPTNSFLTGNVNLVHVARVGDQVSVLAFSPQWTEVWTSAGGAPWTSLPELGRRGNGLYSSAILSGEIVTVGRRNGAPDVRVTSGDGRDLSRLDPIALRRMEVPLIIGDTPEYTYARIARHASLETVSDIDAVDTVLHAGTAARWSPLEGTAAVDGARYQAVDGNDSRTISLVDDGFSNWTYIVEGGLATPLVNHAKDWPTAFAIMHDDDRFVVVGAEHAEDGTRQSVVWASSAPGEWSRVAVQGANGVVVEAACQAFDRFWLFARAQDGSEAMWTSTDASVWEQGTLPSSSSRALSGIQSCGDDGSALVISTAAGRVASTTDGEVWTDLAPLPAVPVGSIIEETHVEGRYVAVLATHPEADEATESLGFLWDGTAWHDIRPEVDGFVSSLNFHGGTLQVAGASGGQAVVWEVQLPVES